MKKRLALPGGIIGLYTVLILVGSLYPVAHLLRSPEVSRPLMIGTTLYFLCVGVCLWLRLAAAAWLFLAGVLGLCGWSARGLVVDGFSVTALVMLAAWLIALPGALVIREEIRAWRADRPDGDGTASGS